MMFPITQAAVDPSPISPWDKGMHESRTLVGLAKVHVEKDAQL